MKPETSPKLMEDINLQVQEAPQTPNRIHTKKNPLKHIMVKLMKNEDNEKMLKAAREKGLIIFKEGEKITIMTDSSANRKPEGNGMISLKCCMGGKTCHL